jgi:serine protease inhibitor ecotin
MVRFFHPGVFRYYQVQVDMPLATCLACPQVMKTDQLTSVFHNAGSYFILL